MIIPTDSHIMHEKRFFVIGKKEYQNFTFTMKSPALFIHPSLPVEILKTAPPVGLEPLYIQGEQNRPTVGMCACHKRPLKVNVILIP